MASKTLSLSTTLNGRHPCGMPVWHCCRYRERWNSTFRKGSHLYPGRLSSNTTWKIVCQLLHYVTGWKRDAWSISRNSILLRGQHLKQATRVLNKQKSWRKPECFSKVYYPGCLRMKAYILMRTEPFTCLHICLPILNARAKTTGGN